MSTLSGRKVKDTFGNLLQVDNNNSGIDGTLRNIQDGEGTASTVQISSAAFNIQSGFQVGGVAVTASAADLNASSTLAADYQPLATVLTNTTASYTTTLDTKLGGIEALADVTDATNVTAAGALMDSELTSIASVKALNQGVATTDTPTFAGIITSGNVDGRDVSVDGTKLDGIEAAADVTDSTNVLASLVGQEVVATGFTGTLDGVLGGGTPAAVNGTTLTSSGAMTSTGFVGKLAGTAAKASGSTITPLSIGTSDGIGATSLEFDVEIKTDAVANNRYVNLYAYDQGTGSTELRLQGYGGSIKSLATSHDFSAGTLSAGATDVTTLTASGDVYTTAKMGVVVAPDALGAPLQVKHSGTVAYLGLDGGNSDTDPVLSTWTDPDPASALHGWSIYNSSSDGAFELFRRNNSTTEIEVASFSRSDGGLTLAGTLSAGATTVTTLTASGNAAINTTLPTINTVDGALLVGSQGSIMCFSNEVDVGHNFYYNSGWKYRTTDTASQLTMGNSGVPFLFQYTASGTADTAITWSEAGRIDASGNWNFQAKSLTTTGTVIVGSGSAGTDYIASGTYTPTWTSTGTAPAIGNGVLEGVWKRVGDMCTVTIVMEAGSTTTFGTGNYRWSLPFAAASRAALTGPGNQLVGNGVGTVSDAGVGYQDIFAGAIYNSSSAIARSGGSASIGTFTDVGATYPMTWATGDSISFTFSYETA
jgi:hypothetical protein